MKVFGIADLEATGIELFRIPGRKAVSMLFIGAGMELLVASSLETNEFFDCVASRAKRLLFTDTWLELSETSKFGAIGRGLFGTAPKGALILSLGNSKELFDRARLGSSGMELSGAVLKGSKGILSLETDAVELPAF